MTTRAVRIMVFVLGLVCTFASTATAQLAPPGKVTITGRLLLEGKSPIVGIHVMLMEARSKDGKLTTTWKIGPDSRLANPTAFTDKDGRFLIEADPAFWAGTGNFTLSGGFLPGTTTNAGILQGPGNVPMLLSVDDKTKMVDLGDINVKKP